MSIIWVQENQFNLQPVTINSGTINGNFQLQANNTWSWGVTITGKSPIISFNVGGSNLPDATVAEDIATAAVSGAMAILNAAP